MPSGESEAAIGSQPTGTGDSTEEEVFVSYSSADGDVADQLVSGLRVRGVAAWFDRDKIDLGDSWRPAVLDGLAAAQSAVVVVGAEGFGTMQREEAVLLLDRRTHEPDFRLVPLFLQRPVGPVEGDGVLAQLRSISAAVVGGRLGDGTIDLLANRLRGLHVVDEPSTLGPCPYPGLKPFQLTEEDAARFHGRDRELAEIAALLGTRNAVCLWGASGIGKSSIARAGIARLCIEDAIQVDLADAVVIDVGPYPLDECAAALDVGAFDQPTELRRALADRAGSGRICLVIDQLEAAFAVDADEAHQAAFVEALVDLFDRPLDSVDVIVTIRSDAAERINRYMALGSYLAEIGLTIGPIGRHGLVDAIQRPAWLAGARFEPGLVDEIVEQVLGQPNGLPLLSLVMEQMWAHASGDTLTLSSYRAIGGLGGVLERIGDAAIAPFRMDDEDLARWFLVRLVDMHPLGPPTRRPVRSGDLVPVEVRDRELCDTLRRRLLDARLIVVGHDAVLGATLQYAHDAVISSWQTLRHWIEDAREQAPTLQRLHDAADAWDSAGRSRGQLLDRRRLAAIERSLAAAPTRLGRTEFEFLARSNRRHRRVRVLRAAVALAAIAAFVVTSISLLTARTERQSRELGDVLRLAATANEQAADRPDLGLLLAAEAVARERESVALSALASGLSARSQPLRFWDTRQEYDVAVLVDVDGSGLVVGSDGGSGATICDIAAESCRSWLEPGRAQVVAIHASGGTAAAVAVLASGQLVVGAVDAVPQTIDGITDAKSAALHPRQPLLAVGHESGEVSIVRLDDPSRREIVGALTGRVRAVAFDPLTRWVAASDGDSVDLMSLGSEISIDGVWRGNVASVSFNHEGDALLIGDVDSGDVVVVDPSAPKAGERRLVGHDAAPSSISTAAGRAVTAGLDDAVFLWDVNERVQAAPPFVARAPASDGFDDAAGYEAAYVSSDGARMSGVRHDGVVVTWDRAGRAALADRAVVLDAPVVDIAPTDEGGLVVMSANGRVSVLDDRAREVGRWTTSLTRTAAVELVDGDVLVLGDGVERRSPAGEQVFLDVAVNGVTAGAVTPDGRIVAGDEAGHLHLLDASSGRRIWTIDAVALGADGPILDVAVDPQGGRAAVAIAGDPDVRLIGLGDQSIDRLVGHSLEVDALTWAADGTLYSGSDDRTVLMWQLDDGVPLRAFIGHIDRVTSVAVMPDSGIVLSVSQDGTLRLWDPATGTSLGGEIAWSGRVVDQVVSTDVTTAVSNQGDELIWWTVDVDAWIDLACSIAGRRLTTQEASSFLPDSPLIDCGGAPPAPELLERD